MIFQQLAIFFSFLTMLSMQSGNSGSPAASGSSKVKSVTPGKTVDTVMNRLDTLRKLPNSAFGVGEYLRFEVKFGFVTAGDAVMMIRDTTLPNGRRCYKIEFKVDSKPVFNWVYRVED